MQPQNIISEKMIDQISLLVNQVGVLQQGDRSVLTYANELSSIFSGLDHYRPPVYTTKWTESTFSWIRPSNSCKG